MRRTLAFTVAALLMGSTGGPEGQETADEPRVVAAPVEKLVTTLSASLLWQNGIFPILDLPATASTDQVIARVFQRTGFGQGHVKDYRILETRQVRISGSLPDVYAAVIVDTDPGKKIVLLKYEGTAVGWWSRVFRAEPSA